MEKRISENIKILGFIMTCFIVFYHIGNYESAIAIKSIDIHFNNLINYIFSTMGYLAMCHFFTVTGFLLFYNLDMKNYMPKMKRRVFSLLIPYIIWQIIIMTIDIFQNQYTFDITDFLIRTFFLVRWPIDGPLWYVYAIFLLALLSPILLILFKKGKKVAWIITITIIVSLQMIGKVTNPTFISIVNYGYIPNILLYLPCYLVGAFYGNYYNKETSLESLKYILSLILVAFLLEGSFPNFFNSTAMKILPLAIIYLMPAVHSLENKWIYKLTFLIYAIHQPIIKDIKLQIVQFLSILPLPLALTNITEHLIILGFIILIATLIYIFSKKTYP